MDPISHWSVDGLVVELEYTSVSLSVICQRLLVFKKKTKHVGFVSLICIARTFERQELIYLRRVYKKAGDAREKSMHYGFIQNEGEGYEG